MGMGLVVGLWRVGMLLGFAGVWLGVLLFPAGVVSASAAGAPPGVVVPRPNAVVMRSPVHVMVRPPAGARRVRVELGSKDVTRHFHRDGSGRLLGVLTRREGLHYGWNEVSLLTGSRRNPHVVDASSFAFARPAPGLVRLTVGPGAVTSLTIRKGDPMQVPIVRAWLNGRSVTRAIDTSNPERWRAELSVSQGLHDGINQLRLVVIEPDRGRYMELRRRFSVRRGVDLAGAGWDVDTIVGARVSLDGNTSSAPGGGPLEYRWRLRSKPPGSRAKLRRASSRRPVLTPDRPGDYVLGLRVAPRSGGALSRADTVEVTVSPDQYLVPFSGDTVKAGKHGIQVGDTFYPNPSPDGNSLQYLTLNRATLEPAENSYGNSYLDGSEASIGKLEGQLVENGSSEQLVVLSFPGGKGAAVESGQIDAFRKALVEHLGVRLTDALFTHHIKNGDGFTVVGIPWSGSGSGYFVPSFLRRDGVDALKGWLMAGASVGREGSPLFRLQTESPEFDTSVERTDRSNTMLMGGQRLSVSIPQSCTGAFEVEPFNATLGTPDSIPVPVFCVMAGGSTNGTELGRMAEYLRGNSLFGQSVAIQSIGTVVAPPPSTGPPENRKDIAWYQVGAELATLGANPHTFNTVNGSYAFVGGDQLERDEVADSSSAVATGGDEETGTLSGRLSLGHDGVLAPTVADATGTAEFKFLDIAVQNPQPWPYTKGSNTPGFKDEEAPAYADALAYITQNLSGGAYKDWGNDLRLAYAGAPQFDWTTAKTDLDHLKYPGDGKTCQQEPGPQAPSTSFTREQFCNLIDELQQEFTWLHGIKNNLFDPYQQVFDASVAGEGKDLESLGKKIRESLEQTDDDAKIAWSIGQFVGELVATWIPEVKAAKEAAETLVAIYSFTREMVDIEYSEKQVPVSDQVDTKVVDLGHELAQRMKASSAAMIGLRQVIISDYGRLKALGSVSFSPKWSVNTGDLREGLDNTARASFSNELVPVGYGVHALESHSHPSELQNASACNLGLVLGHQFEGGSASAEIKWMGNFSRDGYVGWWPTLLVLGKHKLASGSKAYLSPEVSDRMFRPLFKNGYGMQLARFIWEQYGETKPSPEDTGTKGPPTDIAVCSG